MKLKEGFISHQVGDDEYMVVATEEADKVFNGLIRNNGTANFIFQQLLEETTEGAIVEAILDVYDVEWERAAADVHKVIVKIRNAGFLDE